MNLIMCRFFIDINLGLPDNKGFSMNFNSKQIVFTLKRNENATYVSFKSSNVDWGNINDADTSNLTISNDKNEKMILQQIYIGNDDIFKYGFKQYNTSNIIEVVFEEDPSRSSNNETNQTQYINEAKDYLIHFIDIYRYSTQIGFIINPRSLISPLVEILISKNTSFEDAAKKELSFINLTIQIVSEKTNGNVFHSFELPNNMIHEFAKTLSTGHNLVLYEKLILDAREQSFVYKDYPLSIVLIETAFETFTKQKLTDLCTKRGMTTLPVKYKHNKYIPYQDAIESGNIVSDLLTTHLKLILSNPKLSIKSTSEYISWKSNAYAKRNKIVHNGYNNYTLSDAESAFKSVVDFMKYINNLCV